MINLSGVACVILNPTAEVSVRKTKSSYDLTKIADDFDNIFLNSILERRRSLECSYHVPSQSAGKKVPPPGGKNREICGFANWSGPKVYFLFVCCQK
jgi:hypothetical protein